MDGSAQTEIGPDGDKLLIFFLVVLLVIVGLVLWGSQKQKSTTSQKFSFFSREKILVTLGKDRKYYPDLLTLEVKNTGKTDVDLDKPLLVFDNFWFRRKFKLKGYENYSFYPLYLESGKSHKLPVDLNRFYQHDKGLKKYPKVRIIIYNVRGKRLGSTSVFIRQTLIRF
jgi:hypothetical protein